MRTASALAGVDGCRAGWIMVRHERGGPPMAAVFPNFAKLVGMLPDDAIVAVDMPIGLPETCGKGGRGPEALVRRFLGARQSSVFSIPSRAAVYADTGAFTDIENWHAAHQRASRIAKATSNPPRGVSIQAFGIFAKIREIDSLLIAHPELRSRVFESHPEVAFWRLNDGKAMQKPKKIKGVVNPAGMEERKALLARFGYDRAFLDMPPPRGAGADDFLDAVAMAAMARRIAHSEAVSFPDPPMTDSLGIPIAIRA